MLIKELFVFSLKYGKKSIYNKKLSYIDKDEFEDN